MTADKGWVEEQILESESIRVADEAMGKLKTTDFTRAGHTGSSGYAGEGVYSDDVRRGRVRQLPCSTRK